MPPGDVTATSVTLRGSVRYVAVVSTRGSIAVSKWERRRCSAPVISAVSPGEITLDDGTRISMPVAEWIDDAVTLWRATAKDMLELPPL